ncbi:PREDICTED: annexin D4-like [Tarenaya hassleriana]|uniref:annexin D4-like n=1 Tax=Tarenaya hassleriana TaxID=28532 RepID=UPI00053C33C5|nr:PREDICTED: annexin D4-like [Tarenaya hassleriana]
MDVSLDLEVLSNAISGLGVDEKSLVSILGNSHLEHRRSFRKENPKFFVEDERGFERCEDQFLMHLKQEFTRFNNAVAMWTMHAWERDARMVKKALEKGPKSYNLIVEVTCTRSSHELLGARRAYHSLFDRSMEEDVASHVHGPPRKLLVGLVSAYRYEGNRVNEKTAKSEAEALAETIGREGHLAIENDELVRILTTRSKLHLRHVFDLYSEISRAEIAEDATGSSVLSDTFLCLSRPSAYFSKLLDESLSEEADKKAKKWLTRVIVTRADHADMRETIEEYHRLFGQSLAEKIETRTKGNYKDFLLTLLARSDFNSSNETSPLS